MCGHHVWIVLYLNFILTESHDTYRIGIAYNILRKTKKKSTFLPCKFFTKYFKNYYFKYTELYLCPNPMKKKHMFYYLLIVITSYKHSFALLNFRYHKTPD